MQLSRISFRSFLRPQSVAYLYKHISNEFNLEVGGSKEANQFSSNLPIENLHNDKGLELNEIQSRIFKVLTHFDKINLKSLDFRGDIQKDLGLDSLERVALLTSVEHEFSTVFEDRVFDNMKTLQQVIEQLQKDSMIY